MSTHALLSPSKRYRWANCPGSIREEKNYPEESSGPAAIDGTHTHTLLERALAFSLPPSTFIGKRLDDHEGDFIVDADRATRAGLCFDYVQTRISEHNGLCEVKAETKVNPEWLLGRDDMGGTVDVIIVGGDTLELVDYKDGMNDAWESAKLQLEQYAYGVLAGYKIPINLPYPFTKVRMTVVQPKLSLKGGQPIRSAETTVKELLDNLGTIVSQAHRTDQPDAPLIPGDLQCKYCPVKACSARAQKAMESVEMMFPKPGDTFTIQGVMDPSDPTREKVMVNTVGDNRDLAFQAADKDPHTMTDQQLAQLLEAAPLVRQMIENAEAEVLDRLKRGIKVPGFKLVNDRGSRNWSLPEDQMAERLIKMGIPKSEVYETKLVSPAKVEKLKWKAKKGGEEVVKQLTERQLATLEKDYITKTSGKIKVAPESDSRPAITVDAAPLFAAIPSGILVTDTAIEAVTQEIALPDWMK